MRLPRRLFSTSILTISVGLTACQKSADGDPDGGAGGGGQGGAPHGGSHGGSASDGSASDRHIADAVQGSDAAVHHDTQVADVLTPPPGCVDENPEGCRQGSCPDGQACVQEPNHCAPSSCECDPGTASWSCTEDCGGGVCRPQGGATSWYLTCGDPVCGGHQAEPGLPACAGHILEGHPCDTEGARCDPGNDCNARLVCAEQDPRAQPGGCPISKRAFKEDIRYLTPDDLNTRQQALRDLRLAEYRYLSDTKGERRRLGFIIEDGVPKEVLRASEDQVDLYAYTTLAVAAIQSQAKEIERLRAEVEAMKADLAAARLSRPSVESGSSLAPPAR